MASWFVTVGNLNLPAGLSPLKQLPLKGKTRQKIWRHYCPFISAAAVPVGDGGFS